MSAVTGMSTVTGGAAQDRRRDRRDAPMGGIGAGEGRV